MGITIRADKLSPKALEAAVKKAWGQRGSAVLEVLAEASRELTPVATGALRGSCEVEVNGDGGEVKYTADYAVYVHEIPANHPTGQSKFLETAAMDGSVHAAMLEELSDAF